MAFSMFLFLCIPCYATNADTNTAKHEGNSTLQPYVQPWSWKVTVLAVYVYLFVSTSWYTWSLLCRGRSENIHSWATYKKHMWKGQSDSVVKVPSMTRTAGCLYALTSTRIAATPCRAEYSPEQTGHQAETGARPQGG